MPGPRYGLPDLRLIAVRAYLLAQRHYATGQRVQEMPPLAEIDRLVREIDQARERAGQNKAPD